MRLFKAITPMLAALLSVAAVTKAAADDLLPQLPVLGAPEQDGIALQTPFTALAREVQFLDNLLLWIIVPITIFVTGLMIWVIVFHNRRANPEPARFTHNTPIEIAWTVVPALILLFIALFTFPALRHQQIMPEADVTIKVTGFQWYWGYEYVDHDIEFSQFILERDELADYGYTDDLYLLATDTAMVVPVNKNIVLQVTAADVIHAWAMPAFGVKQDGVPGRLAELWFNAEEEGIYFGQCSELCGISHAYMPITVKVVSEEEYIAWLERQGAEFADAPRAAQPVQIATSN
ncbi:cytochrome c oxidase subunit II [Roseinatronobacter alkalisoli]|uniref:Cytochrome c oxidase subunit 2 n=1 Tax=Roseinatronobacter alkalisoli TaxID=3028235 RepID=A0ABT5T9K0_9RHOB|nr:cytochrome c oxidase subunit II [Roseinatronobacter sp. HJB301]MDD7971801.1 cytochrome c oxidase subunit II [Roseinatronobacter sp. HJB301]